MSRFVLIADNHRERALALADACRAHGLDARTVGHGSRALEVALQDPPAVLVAPYDLPLIDSTKLASILRANPKTQQVRFVFLDDLGGQAPPPSDFLDEVISLPAEPGEIARRIDTIVNRQARIEDVGRGDPRSVSGELTQISLPDLVQLFHLNRKSGVIELVRRGADDQDEHGAISLVEGDVVQAAVGVVEGEKALFRLLGWTEGSFAFAPGSGDVPRQIQTPTRNLLLEGMRQVDELHRLEGELPAGHASVALRVKTAELPNTIHPLTQEVLLLLEIYSTVQDVVDRCSFPDYQVLRTLQTLAGRGMIEIRVGQPARPPTLSEAERLFSSAQANRLREWLGRVTASGTGSQAKLLVVSADEGATHDFVRLLRGLPGIRLEGAFAGGTFTRDDLAPIGRLPVDAETGLQLVHVPADSRYAPLWPLAAHGAIGTVFLMAGAIGPAAQRLRGPAEALRSAPRSRLFHVVMVRKGERSLADDLRENTRLFDEVPLFLLPLERDKEPVALLRGLFSRVLP